MRNRKRNIRNATTGTAVRGIVPGPPPEAPYRKALLQQKAPDICNYPRLPCLPDRCTPVRSALASCLVIDRTGGTRTHDLNCSVHLLASNALPTELQSDNHQVCCRTSLFKKAPFSFPRGKQAESRQGFSQSASTYKTTAGLGFSQEIIPDYSLSPWSDRLDLNQRHLAPKASVLPD